MVERRQVKRYLAYLASLTAAGAGLTPVVGVLAGAPSAAADRGTSVRPAVAPGAQLALSNAVPQAAPNVAATCEWGESWGESWSDSWGESWGESCDGAVQQQ